jgi:Cation transport ATPase
METKQPNSEFFDESQSIQVIREMIQVSQKKLKNDGVLFILWGWVMFYNYISSYVLREVVTTYQFKKGFEYFGTGLGIFSFAFTIYYLFRNNRKVTTYIGISLRYVWVSLIACLSLTNIIMFHVLQKFNVELQHPILMLFIAFAIVVTGGILRYRLLIFGGIVFGILAYTCSYLSIEWQALCEAAAWLIAFIIPGHILYAKRKS